MYIVDCAQGAPLRPPMPGCAPEAPDARATGGTHHVIRVGAGATWVWGRGSGSAVSVLFRYLLGPPWGWPGTVKLCESLGRGRSYGRGRCRGLGIYAGVAIGSGFMMRAGVAVAVAVTAAVVVAMGMR